MTSHVMGQRLFLGQMRLGLLLSSPDCGLDLNLALSGRRFGASLKIHVNAPEKHAC